MPLNPTLQDKRGLVLVNADGSFNSLYPLGDKPSSSQFTYHVAIGGNDISGDGTEGDPWETPEFGAKQLSPGESLGIHAGTYILDEANLPAGQQTMDRFRALVSPQNNLDSAIGNEIVISGAGDGTVLLDAGTSPEWMTVGTNYGNGVIVKDLSSRGSGAMMASNNSKFINCDLYGGIDTPQSNGGDNFGCVLRVEVTNGCLVQNCKLHDNQDGITGDNSPLLIEYDTTDLIVEFCDVYNSVNAGLRFKDNPHNIIVRNNHIYDNVGSGVKGTNQDTGADIAIYQNIFRNCNTSNSGERGAIEQLIILTDWQIYNNTFINNNDSDIRTKFTDTIRMELWNNLFYNNVSNFYKLGFSSSGATLANNFTYSDYNTFFGSANFIERNTTWSTLAAYSAANSLDANSTTSDPNFINVAGSNAADFKRSSYPTDGRGGAFESVRGAYIDGTEQIGSTL